MAIIAPLFMPRPSSRAGSYLRLRRSRRPTKVAKRRGLAVPALRCLALSVIYFFANTIEGAVRVTGARFTSRRSATCRRQSPTSGYAVFSLGDGGYAFCRRSGRRATRRPATWCCWAAILVGAGHGSGGVRRPGRLSVRLASHWSRSARRTQYPVLISAGSRVPGAAAGDRCGSSRDGRDCWACCIGPPVIGFVAHSMGLTAGACDADSGRTDRR